MAVVISPPLPRVTLALALLPLPISMLPLVVLILALGEPEKSTVTSVLPRLLEPLREPKKIVAVVLVTSVLLAEDTKLTVAVALEAPSAVPMRMPPLPLTLKLLIVGPTVRLAVALPAPEPMLVPMRRVFPAPAFTAKEPVPV